MHLELQIQFQKLDTFVTRIHESNNSNKNICVSQFLYILLIPYYIYCFFFIMCLYFIKRPKWVSLKKKNR